MVCYSFHMSDVQQSDSSERGDQPGKMRTMWHPLLVRMLDYSLGSAYTVREEVSVGKMPLRVDILLIRREGGSFRRLAHVNFPSCCRCSTGSH